MQQGHKTLDMKSHDRIRPERTRQENAGADMTVKPYVAAEPIQDNTETHKTGPDKSVQESEVPDK